MIISFCRKYCEREFARVGACSLVVRTDLCTLPPHLLTQPTVRLNIGPGIAAVASMDDTACLTRLTFSGEPFACLIPWRAVLRMDRLTPPPKGGTPSAARVTVVSNDNVFARAA